MSAADNILIDTNKRLFYISDDINSASVGKICFSLLSILKQDDENDSKQKDFKREPVIIYVNSFGGSVYDMWSLIDIIENSKTPIYTYCTGYAMSAAFEIFLSGHKRFATKHSTFMYHQMSYWRSGKYQDLVEDRVEMDFLNKQSEQYVVKKTKTSQEYIDEIRERKKDLYIHADDALKLGIIDKII